MQVDSILLSAYLRGGLFGEHVPMMDNSFSFFLRCLKGVGGESVTVCFRFYVCFAPYRNCRLWHESLSQQWAEVLLRCHQRGSQVPCRRV